MASLLLASCQWKSQDGNSEEWINPSVSISADTQKDESGISNIYNPPESTTPAAGEVFVSVDYITDEFLGNYDSVDEFVDYENEYSQKIVFTTNTVIKNFKYIEIGHKAEDTCLVYFESAVLYSLDALLPEKPFVVTWMEVGDAVSYRGIAFTDENNTTRYFYITISGKDGSLLLIEFHPA